ncbi:MAG: RluA family pseudouridine synthase [Candidatus Omnitrophica bacterium]|nr:RluA family pseudouridine synthase [Candidatus Omnitrophota bacterium]MCM8806795.1 RluA family pseudouridine synthase [Candidatus Omnitrophota bacterium]
MKEIKYENEVRIRLDKFLKKEIKFSREKIKNLIKEGKILVNEKSVEPSYLLKKNDLIKIFEEDLKENETIKPEKGEIDILYEDEDIIVVNKPSGILTHPTPKIKSGTLINHLLYHTKLSNIGYPYRPGVVHRLDKETSGVIIFAKNDFSYWSLIEQFRNRIIKKEYYAIVRGKFPEKKKTVEFKISPDKENPTKMKVHYLKGKDALTEIEVEKYIDDYTLLKIKPITGRTHQIRLTLSYLGYPIIGDLKYGEKAEKTKLYLHSYKLTIIHPKTKNKLEFIAPLPQHFISFLTNIKNENIIKALKMEDKNE